MDLCYLAARHDDDRRVTRFMTLAPPSRGADRRPTPRGRGPAAWIPQCIRGPPTPPSRGTRPAATLLRTTGTDLRDAADRAWPSVLLWAHAVARTARRPRAPETALPTRRRARQAVRVRVRGPGCGGAATVVDAINPMTRALGLAECAAAEAAGTLPLQHHMHTASPPWRERCCRGHARRSCEHRRRSGDPDRQGGRRDHRPRHAPTRIPTGGDHAADLDGRDRRVARGRRGPPVVDRARAAPRAVAALTTLHRRAVARAPERDPVEGVPVRRGHRLAGARVLGRGLRATGAGGRAAARRPPRGIVLDRPGHAPGQEVPRPFRSWTEAARLLAVLDALDVPGPVTAAGTSLRRRSGRGRRPPSRPLGVPGVLDGRPRPRAPTRRRRRPAPPASATAPTPAARSRAVEASGVAGRRSRRRRRPGGCAWPGRRAVACRGLLPNALLASLRELAGYVACTNRLRELRTRPPCISGRPSRWPPNRRAPRLGRPGGPRPCQAARLAEIGVVAVSAAALRGSTSRAAPPERTARRSRPRPRTTPPAHWALRHHPPPESARQGQHFASLYERSSLQLHDYDTPLLPRLRAAWRSRLPTRWAPPRRRLGVPRRFPSRTPPGFALHDRPVPRQDPPDGTVVLYRTSWGVARGGGGAGPSALGIAAQAMGATPADPFIWGSPPARPWARAPSFLGILSFAALGGLALSAAAFLGALAASAIAYTSASGTPAGGAPAPTSGRRGALVRLPGADVRHRFFFATRAYRTVTFRTSVPGRGPTRQASPPGRGHRACASRGCGWRCTGPGQPLHGRSACEPGVDLDRMREPFALDGPGVGLHRRWLRGPSVVGRWSTRHLHRVVRPTGAPRRRPRRGARCSWRGRTCSAARPAPPRELPLGASPRHRRAGVPGADAPRRLRSGFPVRTPRRGPRSPGGALAPALRRPPLEARRLPATLPDAPRCPGQRHRRVHGHPAGTGSAAGGAEVDRGRPARASPCGWRWEVVGWRNPNGCGSRPRQGPDRARARAAGRRR
ncbi:hypothetical protein QJS66_07005 [Kocuria rhizophila]|nr:hypothetical protein QJS66_07005 [Kocuria rhizophila]